MVILAIANQKGGVAKTTTAENIGGYFSKKGIPVLGIDLDSQGNFSTSLGLEMGNGLYRFLVQDEPLESVIVHARNNFDLITNDHSSLIVEEHINRSNFREYILAKKLEKVKKYKLIILDCPPSGSSILQLLSLIAADFAIIPTTLDLLALHGVTQIIQTVSSLNTFPNVIPPRLIGILPTFFDRFRTNESIFNMAELQRICGIDLILPPITKSTILREASAHGQTIWEYAPKSSAAVGYKDGTRIKNSANCFGGYLHLCELLSPLVK